MYGFRNTELFRIKLYMNLFAILGLKISFVGKLCFYACYKCFGR